MFKQKITKKLSFYFAIALIIFAIIIGSVFILLFRNYSLDLNRQELEARANSIANTIPDYLESQGSGIKGFKMYLSVINEIEDNAVWIVDSERNLITGGNQHSPNQMQIVYADLPNNADQLINEVLAGETGFSEDFSTLLEKPSLTVGVPILGLSDRILGVVLLHSAVVGVNAGISQGILILLISILLALVVSIFLATLLSRYFTKPLVKMNNSALKLVDNDYSAKTNVEQDDEIGQLAKTLDILANRLDQASMESEKLEKMRRDFITNISHELKTPVTVMRGSLEALVDEVVSDPELVKDYYKQMLSEAKFLERLIKDLLELSKLQSIDFVIEKTNVSMSEVINEVVRSARKISAKKNIEIKLSKEVDDIKIYGDYGRLRQMLMTVLDNAIKFSNTNDVVIITLLKDSITIQDYGVGIDESELDNIFDRFYKSRSEENKTGTGLGLSIAKSIADRHNIKVEVKSIVGQSTTFSFKFNDIT